MMGPEREKWGVNMVKTMIRCMNATDNAEEVGEALKWGLAIRKWLQKLGEEAAIKAAVEKWGVDKVDSALETAGRGVLRGRALRAARRPQVHRSSGSFGGGDGWR